MIEVITLEKTALEKLVRDAVESGVKIALEKHQPQAEPDVSGGVDFASEITGLEKSTIYSLCSKRQIPFSKPAGKLLFWRNELLEWMRQGKRKTNAELSLSE